MFLPKITVRQYKDGREVARFRGPQGLVRTDVGMSGAAISTQGYSAWRQRWTRAEQVKEVADYYITLQREQARAGIGSDGSPMPPLKDSARAAFSARVDGKARFTRVTYAGRKVAKGLTPNRDLFGFGIGGHMTDDIRINYLDDRRAKIDISRQKSRDKARGNERRAPWWGLGPEREQKLRQFMLGVFGSGVVEQLVSLGIVGASALGSIKARVLRRMA
jgi:hypothetical protein